MTESLANGRWFDHKLVLVAQNLDAEISEIDIDRDAYYLEGNSPSEYKGEIQWDVPENCYFMLGDNNRSSRDSRLWDTTRATLKDGRVIEWDTGHNEGASNYQGSQPSDDELVVLRRFEIEEMNGVALFAAATVLLQGDAVGERDVQVLVRFR